MKFHCFLLELKISDESFLVSRILIFFFGEDWFSLQPDLCIGAWQRLHGVLSQEKKGGSIGFQAQTPAGFALFKILKEGKLENSEELWKDFQTPDSARKMVKLKAFDKFVNTGDALSGC